MKIFLSGDFFYDYNHIANDYNEIINKIRNYEKVFINYEGSFSGPNQKRKSVSLAMNDNSLILPNNTSLILCNNHITDFGSSGIKNTISKINSRNIDFFGLNKNMYDNSYYKSYLLGNKNIFIASLGWVNEECIAAKRKSPGVKPFNSQSISDLKKIIYKANSDFKILYIHAGYEWEKYPLPEHVGLAREAIDSGFDLVYFCHSHTVQDYEFYQNKLIHYGLGNFYFSSMRENFPKIADQGICLVIEINNKKINYFYREVKYDRLKNASTIYLEKELINKSLIYENIEIYSRNYKNFRKRKKKSKTYTLL